MNRRHLTVATMLAGVTVVAACGSGETDSPDTPTASATAPATSSSTQAAAALPQGDDPRQPDPADLSTSIDHPFLPLTPGTRWTYRETDGEGGAADVLVTVSDVEKDLADGVTGLVVRDTVWEDGQLVEDTFDWYAQDGEGNVWYLGEDTAEFEDGEVTTTAGSFEAGVDGALAGIALPADPQPGVSYRQEYYAGEAEDNGDVVDTGERVVVADTTYDGVLVTRDTTSLEPDVVEYKFYAPDTGLVLTLDVSGGSGREQLVERTQISRAAAHRAGTTPLGQDYR